MSAPRQVQRLRLRPSQFEHVMYLAGDKIIGKSYVRGCVLVGVERPTGTLTEVRLNGRMKFDVVVPDVHGNRVRLEGCDRCSCGCKYWEHDRCVDCGGTEPVEPDDA
jgi:hypothetical protein